MLLDSRLPFDNTIPLGQPVDFQTLPKYKSSGSMLPFDNKLNPLEQLVEYQTLPKYKSSDSMLQFDNKLNLSERPVEYQTLPKYM
jgi:hypothetical protein